MDERGENMLRSCIPFLANNTVHHARLSDALVLSHVVRSIRDTRQQYKFCILVIAGCI